MLAAGSFCQAAQAASTPAITTQVTSDPQAQYRFGYLDGQDAASGYAAAYGKGTPAYQAAITAATADARYQARNSEGDLAEYFYGYIAGLRA